MIFYDLICLAKIILGGGRKKYFGGFFGNGLVAISISPFLDWVMVSCWTLSDCVVSYSDWALGVYVLFHIFNCYWLMMQI
jgi:hypothetical protein